MSAALGVAAPLSGADHEADGARRRSRVAWLLLTPGLLYLLVFFVAPVGVLLLTSLYERVPGGAVGATRPAFAVSNYSDAIVAYAPQFGRSFLFALIATVLALAIGYPLAYVIGRALPHPPAAPGHPARAGDRALLHQLHPAHHRLEADPRRPERGGRRAQGRRDPARRTHG